MPKQNKQGSDKNSIEVSGILKDALIDIYNQGYTEGTVDGRSDAWECARRIGKSNLITLEDMGFEYKDTDKNPSWDVVLNYTATEAIDKIERYDDNRRDEYKVGTELRSSNTGHKCVVTRFRSPVEAWAVFSDGSSICMNPTQPQWTKTGKCYPQIAEVLSSMEDDKE